MNLRRIIIISAVVLAIVIVGFLVWLFLFQGSNDSASPNTSSPITQDDLLSSVLGQQSSLSRVGNKKIAGFSVQEDSLTTVAIDGDIIKFDLAGNSQEDLPDIPLGNILEASLSSTNRDAVFLVSGNNQEENWVFFNGSEESVQLLPENTKSASFSPGGDLFYVLEDNEETTLVLDSETIFRTPIPDLIANWVDNSNLVLNTKPSGVAGGIVYLLNENTGRLTRFLGNRFGLSGATSPDRSWVLFSETNRLGRDLRTRVLEVSSGEEKTLTVITLPERCVFSQDEESVFCSLFRDDTSSFIMPDDYYKGVFNNRISDIVKINLEDDLIEFIASSLPIDATSLKITNEEDALFFINKIDGNLYRLEL